MRGYVYFISCRDRVKIGFSKFPARRLTKINSDAPYLCELVGSVSTDKFSEKELHERFAHIRQHSEWFRFTDEVRRFVEQHCDGPNGKGKDRFERADLTGAHPIRVWRYEKKLTLDELAPMIGVTEAHLSRMETGASRITANRCLIIEKELDIPRHELRPDLWSPSEVAA